MTQLVHLEGIYPNLKNRNKSWQSFTDRGVHDSVIHTTVKTWTAKDCDLQFKHGRGEAILQPLMPLHRCFNNTENAIIFNEKTKNTDKTKETTNTKDKGEIPEENTFRLRITIQNI